MMAALDKVAGLGDPDRLPVVELRPFMTQEWRPCKSLPEFYDRSSGTFSSLSGSSSKKSLFSGVSTYTDPEKITLTARSDDCNRSERSWNSQRTPKIKDSYVDGSLKDAFITKTSRERSTTDEIKSGDSTNMQFSCFRRALSDMDFVRQQGLQVTGHRMDQTVPRASSMLYSKHWEYYKMSKSNTAPAATSNQAIDNLCFRINALQNAYIDSGIYDAFDRSSTLPSITVKNAPMRWKKTREEKLTRQASAKIIPPAGYRLGVANSLDVLSHYGQPVRVERQLTMQLKNTINQLRRTKDVATAIGVSSRVPARHDFVSSDETYVKMPFDMMSVVKGREDLGETFSRATPNAAKSEIYDSGVESSRSLGGRRSRSNKHSRSGNDVSSPAVHRTHTLPLIGLPTSPLPRSLQNQERPSTSDSGVAADGPTAQLGKMPQIAESDSQRSPGSLRKPGPDEAATDGHVNITNSKGEDVNEVAMTPDTADADSVDDDVIEQGNSDGLGFVSIPKEVGSPDGPANDNEAGVRMPSPSEEDARGLQDDERPSQ